MKLVALAVLVLALVVAALAGPTPSPGPPFSDFTKILVHPECKETTTVRGFLSGLSGGKKKVYYKCPGWKAKLKQKKVIVPVSCKLDMSVPEATRENDYYWFSCPADALLFFPDHPNNNA